MSITNALAGIASAIPTSGSVLTKIENVKNSVELTGKSKSDKLNWNSNKSSNWKIKPVASWNKKDLVKYWSDEYYRHFGAYPGNAMAYPAHYQSLEGIKFMLEKALEVEEATPPYIKWYFDWVFNNNIPEKIIVKRGNCVLFDIKNEKFILEFKHFVKTQPNSIIEEAVGSQDLFSSSSSSTATIATEVIVPSNHIAITDIEDAYSIHSQYFLENFGIIIPIAYLVNIKNKTLLEAKNYVIKAVDKINQSQRKDSLQKIISATNKYQPYPKWLPLTDIKEIISIDIEIAEENSMFNQLRRN